MLGLPCPHFYHAHVYFWNTPSLLTCLIALQAPLQRLIARLATGLGKAGRLR